MKLNKQQQGIIDEIFNMLETTGNVLKWEITIPLGFSKQSLYQDLNNQKTLDYLNKAFIDITINMEIEKPLRIYFGNRKYINQTNKQMTIHYKYAKDLLIMILKSVDPTIISIKTRLSSFEHKGQLLKYFGE